MNCISRSALLTILVFLTACASTGDRPRTERYDPNQISRAEIDRLRGQVGNLYDLVARARPLWLNRGYVVYQGQTLVGGLSVLREMTPGYAQSLTLLDRSQAVAQLGGLGSRRIDGAIVIRR